MTIRIKHSQPLAHYNILTTES